MIGCAHRGGTSRRVGVVFVALLTVSVLAACGSDDTSSDGGPDTSAPPSAGESGTSQPTTDSTAPEPAVESTASQPTEPAVTAASAGSAGGYVPVDLAAVPVIDGKSDPIEDPLPDGIYWSWEYTSDGDATFFVLSQLFNGDTCRQQFGDTEGACASDNETLYEPSATITMSGRVASATVLSAVAGGFERFGVSPMEFGRLAAGLVPASDAPANFSFERHPVMVTVRGGEPIAVDQVFMS